MKNFILLTLLVLLAGCATTPKIDWDARVGTYTYNQAVAEFGPPESSTLAEGSIVATWIKLRGQRNATYHSMPDGRVIRFEGVPDPDHLLRLTFGTDGKLKDVKHLVR